MAPARVATDDRVERVRMNKRSLGLLILSIIALAVVVIVKYSKDALNGNPLIEIHSANVKEGKFEIAGRIRNYDIDARVLRRIVDCAIKFNEVEAHFLRLHSNVDKHGKFLISFSEEPKNEWAFLDGEVQIHKDRLVFNVRLEKRNGRWEGKGTVAKLSKLPTDSIPTNSPTSDKYDDADP